MGMNPEWRLENRRGLMNYEFDYGKGYVYSLEKRSFNFDIELKETSQFEVWLRVFGPQRVTLVLDEFTNTQRATPRVTL